VLTGNIDISKGKVCLADCQQKRPKPEERSFLIIGEYSSSQVGFPHNMKCCQAQVELR
jgi:hypothetical protein